VVSIPSILVSLSLSDEFGWVDGVSMVTRMASVSASVPLFVPPESVPSGLMITCSQCVTGPPSLNMMSQDSRKW
jgi:hypothetical protein